MARTVSIAACNFAVRPVSSFDEFAAHVRQLLDGADGADLVLFPELFTVELFTTFPEWKELPASELIRVDHTLGTTIPFRERGEGAKPVHRRWIASHEGKRPLLNIGHLYEPDGTLHMHEKTHIFPAEAEWQTEEGDEMRIIDLPFARVGFNICYEAEIPECSSALTEQGVESSFARRSRSPSTGSGESGTAPRLGASRTRCTSYTAALAASLARRFPTDGRAARS